MSFQTLNIKTTKKCAICKYWYDPTNSAINPKTPQMNIWEFDSAMKKMCLQKGMTVSASGSCGKYCCKLELL